MFYTPEYNYGVPGGLKNLLDVAVLEHAEVHRELDPAKNFRKVDEIPFDFTRRRMSVVVDHEGDHLLIPRHVRHRVERTDPDRETIWLAVHFSGDDTDVSSG